MLLVLARHKSPLGRDMSSPAERTCPLWQRDMSSLAEGHVLSGRGTCPLWQGGMSSPAERTCPLWQGGMSSPAERDRARPFFSTMNFFCTLLILLEAACRLLGYPAFCSNRMFCRGSGHLFIVAITVVRAV